MDIDGISRWKILINFDEVLVSTFWKTSKIKSIKQSPAAIDYFIFRKNSLRNIPDFVIGRPGYDNWLIWYARRNFIPVIDLSKEVSAI